MGFWDNAGGAIIGGGMDIAGGIIGNIWNSVENKKNRKFSREMYQQSLEDSREDAETAYKRQKELTSFGINENLRGQRESPSAMKEGYLDAGLNLGLAMGNGSGGSGGGVASTHMADGGKVLSAQSNAMNKLEIGAYFADMRLKNAQAKALEEDAQGKEIENQGKKIDKDIKEKFGEKTAEATLEGILADNRNKDLEYQSRELQKGLLAIEKEIADKTKEFKVKEVMENLRKTTNEANKIFNDIQISNRDQDNKDKMTKAYIDYYDAQVKNLAEQTAAQKFSNELNEEQREQLITMMQQTAKLLTAKCKNEDEFKERWKAEMNQRKWEMWVKAGTDAFKTIGNIIGGSYLGGVGKGLSKAIEKTEVVGAKGNFSTTPNDEITFFD